MNRPRITQRSVLFLLLILTAAVLTVSVQATAKAQADNKATATLKAEDKDGLPVPENYTDYSGEQTPYYRSITASSPSSLKAVLNFYKHELPLNKWKELPGALVGADKGVVAFENDKQDRLEVKLTVNSKKGTDIVLTVKSKGPAKEAGIIPPAGKARIYFGNATDNPVEFAIEKKTYTVKQQSTSDPSMKDAPYVDVAPGSYPFTLTLKGQKPAGDKIEVGADETWGLIAGPGGALPLRMY
jgi:hypothetical protein